MGELPGWAAVTSARRAHIERVAALIGRWADQRRVAPPEAARWCRAAWLHDALRDAAPERLRALAPEWAGPAQLAHGPAAASAAAAAGETDLGVLDAVRYHSIGYAGWDDVGRMLYCADYLEPGRTFEAALRRELAERLPADPIGVLLEVARRRLIWLVGAGWRLPQETVEFWNALARGG